jgi:hypothetical protein
MIALGVGLILAHVVSVVARPSMMELTGSVEIPGRLWMILLLFALFVAPHVWAREAGHRLPASIGFVALTLPLAAVLVYPRACHRMMVVLLLLWWGVLLNQPVISLWIPIGVFTLLTLAAGATHLHFRHVRHQRSGLDLMPVALGALGTLAAAVPIALVAWFIIPRSLFFRFPTLPQSPAAPINAPTATRSDLMWLLFEASAALLVASVLLLVAGYLMRRFRKKRKPVPFDFQGEGAEGGEWDAPPPKRRPRRRQDAGESVRERVIAAYHNATDAMRDRGWEFPEHRTAHEFHRDAERRQFAARAALGDLTAIFEKAEYGTGELKEDELGRAMRSSRDVETATQH